MISTEKYEGIPYVFENGPLVVPTLEVARDRGANCQWLVRDALNDELRRQGSDELPPTMRSLEMYTDRNFSRLVDHRAEPIKKWDVVIFGQGKDAREYHPTLWTGTVDKNGRPQLFHMNFQDDGVTAWSLDQFKEPRYQLKAVKRFINP